MFRLPHAYAPKVQKHANFVAWLHSEESEELERGDGQREKQFSRRLGVQVGREHEVKRGMRGVFDDEGAVAVEVVVVDLERHENTT